MATVKFAAPPKQGDGSASLGFAAELKQEVDRHFAETGRSRNATPGNGHQGTALHGRLLRWLRLDDGRQPPRLGDAGDVRRALGVAYAGIGFNVGHDAVHEGVLQGQEEERLPRPHLRSRRREQLPLAPDAQPHPPHLDEHPRCGTRTSTSRRRSGTRRARPLKWYHRFQHLYAWPDVRPGHDQLGVRQGLPAAVRQEAPAPSSPRSIPSAKSSSSSPSSCSTTAGPSFSPTLLLGISFWWVLLGFTIAHFVAGVILGVVFQLAHVVEEARFPAPADGRHMADDWHAHQLRTTCDFATRNRLLTWYVGGLNFQIEHHLLPKVCSAHYEDLRPIVKRLAQKHGLPHYEAPSLWRAIRSHYRMLRRLGHGETVETHRRPASAEPRSCDPGRSRGPFGTLAPPERPLAQGPTLVPDSAPLRISPSSTRHRLIAIDWVQTVAHSVNAPNGGSISVRWLADRRAHAHRG